MSLSRVESALVLNHALTDSPYDRKTVNKRGETAAIVRIVQNCGWFYFMKNDESPEIYN